MLNNLPLHALIVHMPIALTVLVPLFALLGLWLGRRILKPHVAWALPVGMLTLLLVSGFAAEKTGEQQEDRVEKVVPEAAFEKHEEAAELFLVVTGGVLVLAAGGLMSNSLGKTMRVVGTVGTLAVLAAGWNVGHSGGQLVYQYNAGAAYSTNGAAAVTGAGTADTDDDH
jgi:prepilin signal peptidase PulO-like enzyme (type II secretory pathway)